MSMLDDYTKSAKPWEKAKIGWKTWRDMRKMDKVRKAMAEADHVEWIGMAKVMDLMKNDALLADTVPKGIMAQALVNVAMRALLDDMSAVLPSEEELPPVDTKDEAWIAWREATDAVDRMKTSPCLEDWAIIVRALTALGRMED